MAAWLTLGLAIFGAGLVGALLFGRAEGRRGSAEVMNDLLAKYGERLSKFNQVTRRSMRSVGDLPAAWKRRMLRNNVTNGEDT